MGESDSKYGLNGKINILIQRQSTEREMIQANKQYFNKLINQIINSIINSIIDQFISYLII